MSLAQRLDAADGVIDGKYYGRPIVETRPAYAAPLAAPYATTYGAPYAGYRSSTAAALDAADGVIDGRYYGRPIVETAPATAYATAPYRSSTAAALDAADGVIDGRYFGRPIVETAPVVGGPVVTRYGPGPRVVAPRPYASSTALALDAADGVIDGRYYGRPIVEAGGYPARRYGGYPVTAVAGAYPGAYPLSGSVTRYGPRYYDDAAVTYGGSRYYDDVPLRRYAHDDAFASYPYYGRGYGAYGSVTHGSSALALDAADGVIDGRFYGRPIVERRAYSPYGRSTSLAERLDAADGVMDGQYFGRRIVQK